MDARDVWRSKTDEQVLEAFNKLGDYTPEGQEIIRSELSRRALTPGTPVPEDRSPDDVSEPLPPTERPFRKRWLLMWAMLGAVVGAATYYSLPSVYRSRAVIQVVPPRVPEGFLKTVVKVPLDSRVNGMAQQILSSTRLEALIVEFNLYAEERKTEPMEDVIDRMRDRDIRIDVVEEGAFNVWFDAGDRDTAMRVTQQLAQLFIDESLRDRELSTKGFQQFLESQAEEMRQRLAESQSQLGEYPHQSPPQALVIENEILRESYKTTFRNILESEMAVAIEGHQIGEQFRLLESARSPEKPFAPAFYPFLWMGAVCGFACGLFLWLVSFLRRRRRLHSTPVPA
jgi:uncharacterized protein involved in exopolysaccharide biosynthesis